MFIYKAGVVGAGAMGSGIAQVISFSGLPVVLKDVTPEAVEKGMENIRKIYKNRVDKGKMQQQEVEQKLSLIIPSTSYDDFKDVDIVIEAVFEDMQVKKAVFQELQKVCPQSTIFASNTSALSISELASYTTKADKVVGMHFFNPASVMKLVEVIPGLGTSEETVSDVVTFAESLRKIPVKVQECAGFLVNRLLMPYLNEAVLCLQEGSSGAKQIDEAMTKFGMPMGPFTLMDMLGLDVCDSVSDILYNSYGPRMQRALLLKKIAEAKRLGTKNGKGFYNYNSLSGDLELDGLIAAVQKETGSKKTTFSEDRLLLIQINEAATCLQEGVSSASEIDMAMIAGTGYPQDKGGPLHLADQMGLPDVLKKLEEFSANLGFRFWPAPLLKRKVAAGYHGLKTKKGFFEY